MIKFLRKGLSELSLQLKEADKKIIIIFLSVAVLQTVSWYYTSRRFFRINLYGWFKFNDYADLIEFYYWFLGDAVTYLVLPFLIIRFVLKEKISSYGINLNSKAEGFRISLIFYLVMLPLLWIATSFTNFQNSYPYLNSAKDNWNIFIIYEAGILIYMFAWEFMWRGFTLMGLREKFGIYAVFIQMIPFVILHNGKPAAETFGSIAAGFALGYLAYRTGSILYGFFIHGGVMLTIDLISALRFRTGQFGIGISSIYNIIKNLQV